MQTLIGGNTTNNKVQCTRTQNTGLINETQIATFSNFRFFNRKNFINNKKLYAQKNRLKYIFCSLWNQR